MTQMVDIVDIPFEQVATTQYEGFGGHVFDRVQLLQPSPGTVEDIARKYGLRYASHKGRLTTGDVQRALRDAAFALNRAVGKRWSDGAVEAVMPAAATTMARKNSTNPERIAALYLAILEMPRAYKEFITLRGLPNGTF